MGNLTANKKTLDKYFGILNNLDAESKKKLVSKLNKSVKHNKKIKFNIDEVYGAWQDSKSADEIINELIDSRSINRDTEEF